MTTDELDQLLLDRFNLHRSDLIAALKTLPAHRPWAATLTADEARLLDDAGFTEDPETYAEIAADITAHMARLYSSAYTAAEVREGLGVNDSRVRQRRLAHTLWAINDGGTWYIPRFSSRSSTAATTSRSNSSRSAASTRYCPPCSPGSCTPLR